MRTVRLGPTRTTLLLVALALVAGCNRIRDDWKAAQTADTVSAYQQFIREHSDSEFGSQAEARIQQLLEDADWKAAATADTRDAYEQFVAQHADGKWAQEARVRIENFKLAAAGTTPAPTPVPAPAHAAPAAAKPAATQKPQVGQVARVQLGAFGSSAAAQAAWSKLRGQWPRQTAGLNPRYEPVKSGGKTLYRLRVSLPSRGAADALCGALRKQKQGCILVAG